LGAKSADVSTRRSMATVFSRLLLAGLLIVWAGLLSVALSLLLPLLGLTLIVRKLVRSLG
ncbi:hypothetical protein ACQWBR_23065, partial [Salmonella enterica subsp. enterica serovar Infantis]